MIVRKRMSLGFH